MSCHACIIINILFSLQIIEEGFLEFINNILMIGMIPALFGDDEKDSIINSVRNASAEAGHGVAKFVLLY